MKVFVLYESSQLHVTVTEMPEVEFGLHMIIIKFKWKPFIKDICVCRSMLVIARLSRQSILFFAPTPYYLLT